MGLHEWILVGLAVVAGTVAAVEIRKSKRPRAVSAIGDTTVHGAAGDPFVARSRHVLLVGHTAVTRVSIRRALEQYMVISEARSATDGLDRLNEVIGPDVDVTLVVDLTGDLDDTDDFIAQALAEERDHLFRLLVVSPETDRAFPHEQHEARVEYLPQPQSIPTLLAAIRREPQTAP